MAEVKKQRSTAKGLFTRVKNGLQKALRMKDDVEIIESRFAELTRRFGELLEKHELYVYELEDQGVSVDEEDYVDEIEKEFDDLQRECCKYIKENRGKDIKDEPRTVERFEMVVKEVQKAKQVRELEKSNFMEEISLINDMLKSRKDPEVIRSTVSEAKVDAKAQLERCKVAQANYVALLSEEEVVNELKWVNGLQQSLKEISLSIAEFNVKYSEVKDTSGKESTIFKLERMPLPQFEGEIRDYASFKNDFQKQVVPGLSSDEAKAYVLKSCLRGAPLEIVKNVDHDVKEMWDRLEERYGKASILTDVILNEIKKMQLVEDNDERGFLDLVDIVERGHRDLKRASLESEMSNTSVVSIIEGRLPRFIKREWSSVINKKGSVVDERNKFPSLLEFLLEQKRIIEYNSAELRNPSLLKEVSGSANFLNNKRGEDGSSPDEKDRNLSYRCWRHKTNNHAITECNEFLAMTPDGKLKELWKNKACWSCLRIGHRSIDCRFREPCNIDGCKLFHHKILHDCHVKGLNFHVDFKGLIDADIRGCLLQLMRIPTKSEKGMSNVNVLFDGGATLSLITFKKAKELGLEGKPVKLSVIKVGGTTEEIESYKYDLYLIDKKSVVVPFRVYGMNNISTEVKQIKVEDVMGLFDGVRVEEIRRPYGSIDVLIGFEYAGCHPVKLLSVENLLVLENRFGKCLGGSHPLLKEKAKKLLQYVSINHFKGIKIDDFFETENLGVEVEPRCGNCSCGSCPIGGKNYTIAEERELKLIEDGLVRKPDHWEATYPWKRSPLELPDNKLAALGRLRSTEKRLAKDQGYQMMYQDEIKDMIARGVAAKLTPEEIKAYDGPIHYVSHHEVLKPDSQSTPCRIVFNSSASFNGHVLNDYWAKGPDLINNLLGILIRFRENRVAVTGDISKMYHSVYISMLDQHTHRFLWRDMETDKDPDTYVMKKVCFGDKPGGNIATVALRKTAEEGKEMYPKAAELVLKNTYVDDMIDSFGDVKEAAEVTKDVDQMIEAGGFEVKKWIISADIVNVPQSENITRKSEKIEFCPKEASKVLGVNWNPATDQFQFKVKVNFSPRRRKVRTGPDIQASQLLSENSFVLTKRIVLSQVNGIYDPLGLAGPFTMKAKVLMRNMWIGENRSLGWDDPLPEEVRKGWINFFQELFLMEEVKVPRCIRPLDFTGNPILVLFSDGSETAFGAAAYVRWKRRNGLYESRLLSAKSRVAPLKRVTIVRLELNGAVLSKRLRVFIEKESRLTFEKTYHIVDSQIVKAMIQSESYGFQTYAAVRIGEIQEHTNKSDWYWVNGQLNVSDYLTRGRKPSVLGAESEWQEGPGFLKLPEEEWPVKSDCYVEDLPEQVKVCHIDVKIVDTLASRIKIERYSDFLKLMKVTARVLYFYRRLPTLSFRNALLCPTRKDLDAAEYFWVKEAQSRVTEEDLEKRFRRLSPRRKDDGVIVVGQRAEKWMHLTYNEDDLILIPYNHPFSKLYAEFIHKQSHLGVAATMSKIRLKYWIINLSRMVKSIRYHCVHCRKLCKKLETQVMGQLPIDRLKPAPAWSSTSIDYFGPFETRGETNKRSRGKAYGVIFTCMLSRAVHLDLATNYSTDAFLQVLRRFVAIRGHPVILRSDPGSQLIGASKELRHIVKGLDQSQIRECAARTGFEWKFSPADAPWHNGCVEALIKSVKKSICSIIGAQVLMYSELLTVFFEIANIMNERPIGIIPSDIDDGSYICPNDLLLGRATSRVPSASFNNTYCPRRRFNFIQKLVDAYWIKWNRFYFPTLLVRQKWHSSRRNMMVGDIVLVQDSNAVRGSWKMARVSKTFLDNDGKVRKVTVEYKNLDPDEKSEYKGKHYTRIERPVQRLVVLLPADHDANDA